MIAGPPAIRRQMAHGAAWMFLQRFAVRGIGLVSTIVLARLLAPGDFGIVALATGFLGLLESVGELGFDLQLVQTQTDDRAAYNTAWTLTVLRGVVIAAILAAIARPVAGFYGDPRLVALMYWVAFGVIVTELQNIGIVEFRRDLRFDLEFRLMVWSKVGSFLVTILLAVWLRSYFALIGGIIAGKLITLAMSYAMHPFRPVPSLKSAGKFVHFSSWLSLNNVMYGIKNRIDVFIVGRYAGASLLGVYSVGCEISNLIATELLWPVARVVFSGFAKMAGDRADLRKGFLDVLGLLFMIATPVAVGTGLTAEHIVRIFLGQQWLAAIPLIQILALYGVVNFATANSQAIYLALGRPDLMALGNLPAFLMLPPLLLWGIARYGLAGAAWALVADGTLNLVVNIALMRRQIDFSLSEVFACLWRPAIAASVMAASVAALSIYWPIAGTMIGLVAQFGTVAATGALVYFGVLLLLWRIAGLPDGAERNALAALHAARKGPISAA